MKAIIGGVLGFWGGVGSLGTLFLVTLTRNGLSANNHDTVVLRFPDIQILKHKISCFIIQMIRYPDFNATKYGWICLLQFPNKNPDINA